MNAILKILHSSINSQAASIFQKVRNNIRVMKAIFNLFFVKLESCHPDDFKAAYPIHSIFKYCIADAIINSWTVSIFQKVLENIIVMVAIFNLLRAKFHLVSLKLLASAS